MRPPRTSRTARSSRSSRSRPLLAGAGAARLSAPKVFDAIVPRAVPGSPLTWAYACGAAESARAAGIARPAGRRVPARGTTAFPVGLLPADVRTAVDPPAPLRNTVHARAALVRWTRRVARSTEGAV